MINKCKFLFVICLSLISSNSAASANNFIRETERLIALSDKTYTVVVNQYEQTSSYWSGINRLIIRVLDISTNQLISEALISSTRADTAMEKPFETTYSLIAEAPQAINNVLIPPQALYENLNYPIYRFHIDSKGVYINKAGRQDILDYSVIRSRFSKAHFDLDQAINSNDLEFNGWYKASIGKTQRFFFVLKLGRVDDDTGGLEYVFSIPNAKN